jgi:glycosyltransferase involved in cell wall biosynthesis
MGDFARGGTSRYTANLFNLLSTEVDFHVIYFSSLCLDTSIHLACPVEPFQDRDQLVNLIDWSDHISAICIHPTMTASETILKLCGAKLFIQVHGTCSWTKSLIDFGAKHTNRFFCCSRKAATLLPTDSNFFCAETPLDFNRLHRQQTKEAAKTRFGLSGFKVVTVACRQSYDKNLIGIAELIASLPSDYKLFCVGTGIAESTIHPQMQAILGDRIIFWRGWLEPYEYLDASDCFLCLSPSEGLPTTVIEALVHGTPVVSTPVGIVPELVLRTPGRLSRPIVLPPEELQLACEGYSPTEQHEIFQYMLQRFNHHSIRSQWLDWLAVTLDPSKTQR